MLFEKARFIRTSCRLLRRLPSVDRMACVHRLLRQRLFKVRMSIGYIILAYKLPEQVRRLVSALLRESSDVVVLHVDKKSWPSFSNLEFDRACASNVMVVTKYDVGWGHYSTVQTLLYSLDLILRRYPTLTHIKYLSGQDYPIQPLADFRSFLGRLEGRSLLEYHALPWQVWIDGGDPSGGLDRVTYMYIRVFGRWVRLPFRRHVPRSLRINGGSALWCLCRNHAELILKNASSYCKHFRYGITVDELFFQTLVRKFIDTSELVNNDYTYTLWTHGAQSPMILQANDFSTIVDSGCWFARKFDSSVDGRVLDLVDNHIAGSRVA